MVDLGKHVFPVRKYRLIYERLLVQGVRQGVLPDARSRPRTRTSSVSTRRSTSASSKAGDLSRSEIEALELPFLPELTRFAWLHMGGTILTAETALRDGLCFHIGGGFHHAFADHGEGFCVLNDMAVAVEKLRAEGRIAPADDRRSATSTRATARPPCMPAGRTSSRTPPPDGHLSGREAAQHAGRRDCGRATATKNTWPPCGPTFPASLEEYKPDFVFYLAGADPLTGDKLGGLTCTLHGLAERDRLILEESRGRGIPVAVALAGGYGRDLEDTVQAHVNTIQAARRAQRTARRMALRRRLVSGK